jgi:hypothetical protein
MGQGEPNGNLNDATHSLIKESDPYRLVVEDLGRIAKLHIPEHWQETSSKPTQDWAQISYSRDFSPPNASEATLSIYFRGFLISESSAQRFLQLLIEPPHKLATQEINSINQVLSRIADEEAFAIREISTKDLSGCRVLIIDGEWKTSQTQFQGLMVAADVYGREIQEIFFEAPASSFMKYANVVTDSIRKINWKGL